jgi:hypothetical protein
MGEEDCDQLTDEIPKDHLPSENLWIFGYGSLIWRPACEIEGQETARLKSAASLCKAFQGYTLLSLSPTCSLAANGEEYPGP